MIDADDRKRIIVELSKLSHPLEHQTSHLYNIANGALAHTEARVNVSDSVMIGEKMASEFQASLPSGFYAGIS